MKVSSEGQAFYEANKLMNYDYEYDVYRSKKAGYPIYFTTKEGVNEWISHLGNRLEVNLENGKTVNIWIDDDSERFEEREREKLIRLANKFGYISF